MTCCDFKAVKCVYHKYTGALHAFVCDCQKGDSSNLALPRWSSAKKAKYQETEPSDEQLDKNNAWKYFKNTKEYKTQIDSLIKKYSRETIMNWYREFEKGQK